MDSFLLDVTVLTDRFPVSLWSGCGRSAGPTFFLEVVMAYRKKMSKRRSRRDFTRKSGTHGKNYKSGPMRGGIRL